MSTIHNPVNFVPTDYKAVSYLDNRAPDANEFFFAMGNAAHAAEMLKAARERFHEDFAQWFGWSHNGLANIPHNCVHCGQRIRYVVVAEYTPTGEYVAIGETCAHRIDMTLEQFRVKKLHDVAAKRNKTIALGGKYARYMSDNIDFASAIEKYETSGARNSFVDDVMRRLRQYGSLSDAQRDAVINAVDRAIEYAERKAEREQRDAEAREAAIASGVTMTEGRREIVGEVLSVKSQDSYYGVTVKMLVKDSDGLK